MEELFNFLGSPAVFYLDSDDLVRPDWFSFPGIKACETSLQTALVADAF
jgi:hypothetical protein